MTLESQASDLPLPLAVVVKEYLDEPHPVLKLHRLCDATEMLVRFLSTIALAEVLATNKVAVPSALKNALIDSLERPTFGQWVGILREACKALPTEDTMLFPELRSFARDVMAVAGSDSEPLDKAVISLRNSLAHRRVTLEFGAELLAAPTLSPRFEELLTSSAAGFLRALELIGITEDEKLILLRGPSTERDPFVPDARFSATQLHPGAIIVTRADASRILQLYPLQRYARVLYRDRIEPVTTEAVGQVYARTDDVPQYIALHSREGYSDSTRAVREALEAIVPLPAWRRERQLVEEARIADAHLRATVTPFRFRDIVESLLNEAFVGRAKDLATVSSWLETHSTGAGIVYGKPGMGKTAFAVHLSVELRRSRKKWLCLHHFFKTDDDRCSARQFMIGVLLRLEVEGAPHVELPVSDSDAHVSFIRAVTEFAASRLGAGKRFERLVLIVDGLDEIAQRNTTFVQLIRTRIEGLVWLVLSRDDDPVTRGLEGIGDKIFDDNGLPPLDRQAVRQFLVEELGPVLYEYLRHEGPNGDSTFLDRLSESGRNLPLYLKLLLPDLRSREFRFDRPDTLPSDIDAYYNRLLQRLPLDDAKTVVPAVVALLAVASTPLTEAMLDTLLIDHELHNDPEWNRILGEALHIARPLMRRTFLWGETTGYTLYHHSFQQYLLSRASSHETFPMAASLRRARLRILTLARKWSTLPQGSDARRYAILHGPDHLIDAKDIAGLRSIADENVFQAIADEVSDIDALETARRVIETLPAKASDPTAEDADSNWQALIRSAYGYVTALERIRGEPQTLARLIERGEIKRLQSILDKGSDANVVRRSLTEFGVAPLLARAGHHELARTLLERAHARLVALAPEPPQAPQGTVADTGSSPPLTSVLMEAIEPVPAALAVALLSKPESPWDSYPPLRRRLPRAERDSLPWLYRLLSWAGSAPVGLTIVTWIILGITYAVVLEFFRVNTLSIQEWIYTVNRAFLVLIVIYVIARGLLKWLRPRIHAAALGYLAAADSQPIDVQRRKYQEAISFLIRVGPEPAFETELSAAFARYLGREIHPAAAVGSLSLATLLLSKVGTQSLIAELRTLGPPRLLALHRAVAAQTDERYSPGRLLEIVVGTADLANAPDLLVELMNQQEQLIGRAVVPLAEPWLRCLPPIELIAPALLLALGRAARSKSREGFVTRAIEWARQRLLLQNSARRLRRIFWTIMLAHVVLAFLLAIPNLLFLIVLFSVIGTALGRVWDPYKFRRCRPSAGPIDRECVIQTLVRSRAFTFTLWNWVMPRRIDTSRVAATIIAAQLLTKPQIETERTDPRFLRWIIRQLVQAGVLAADKSLIVSVMNERMLLDLVAGVRLSGSRTLPHRTVSDAEHAHQLACVLPMPSLWQHFGLVAALGLAGTLLWWTFELALAPGELATFLSGSLVAYLCLVLWIAAAQHGLALFTSSSKWSDTELIFSYQMLVGFLSFMVIAFALDTGSKDRVVATDLLLPFTPVLITNLFAPELIARWRGAARLYPNPERSHVLLRRVGYVAAFLVACVALHWLRAWSQELGVFFFELGKRS